MTRAGNTNATLIVESKLYPTTGTRSPLPRPRLESACDHLGDGRAVVLVTAPAGYGKSTLMAQWYVRLESQGLPCAWLSLDDDDNDKARLLRHLAAALHHVDSSIGSAAPDDLTADFSGDAKPHIEALAVELSTVQRQIVLFLDDLHLVQDPDSIQIVDWLVNYGPRTCRYIIGTRDKHGLRLSGLRVRRELLEIDLRQLQFNLAEAVCFFRARLGHDLPTPDLKRLLAKTEGWPAALELAALALAGLREPSQFVDGFAGSHSTLVEYLGEAVLSRLDEETRSGVFRVSMLDRVCVPLAQALGEIRDAEELIRTLQLRNLFLIPLDDHGTWFRFHHLVGDFFRERYRRSAPAEAEVCLVRGAHWMHSNGYIEDAVNCLLRAEHWEQATRWIAESLEELVFRRGYHQTILRWMNALPETWVDRYPVIRIQYAFALAFYARYQKYEAQIYALQRLLQRSESHAERDNAKMNEVRCAVELLTAMSTGLRDDGALGGELAAEWLARWPQESMRRRGVMGNVLAFGYKTAGAIAPGLQVIAESRRWLEQDEGYYALSWTAYLEAVLHMKRGSFLEAKHACEMGLELVKRELQGHRGQSSMLHALLAGIAYEFDEIELAASLVEQAMGSVSECSHADAIIVAFTTQARIQILRHEQDSAMAILREGQELGQRRELRRVTLSLAAEECAQLGRAGCLEEARLVATRFDFHELSADRPADLLYDKALRAASRYLLLQRPAVVILALDRAIESCGRRGFAHRSVELLLLRALARQQASDREAADTDLVEALVIAAPRRYLRVFLDEADGLKPLAARLNLESLRGASAAPLARRVQERILSNGREAVAQTPAIPGSQLTRREVSILKRLESGLSNREIAEALFVSEGTLKWHLHNVYGKLDVKNRSGAIARAKYLRIL